MGTPPIRGEQDRYTFSGMPIYRDDAASLHSHDRLRFRQMSDVNLQEPSQAWQGTCDVVLEQNRIEEGPDNGTLDNSTSPAQVINLTSSTRDSGQNGDAVSGTTPGTAGKKQTKNTWRARWGALRSSAMQRRDGAKNTSCHIAKPIAQGMRWVGQGCLCWDKDEDESSDEISRQSIRLVQV